MLKPKYEWCFSKRKNKKIDAPDAIITETAKTNKNNIFSSKQTTQKKPPKIFRGFKLRTKSTIDVLNVKGQNGT